MRSRIRELDPGLVLTDERRVTDVLAEGLWAPRTGATLLGLLGGLALMLAAIGIYGVVNHSVSLRTQEVALRQVFGASKPQLYALLIRQGMRPAWIGLVVGLAASLALGPRLSSLLYGIGPRDITALSSTAMIVLGISLAACLRLGEKSDGSRTRRRAKRRLVGGSHAGAGRRRYRSFPSIRNPPPVGRETKD